MNNPIRFAAFKNCGEGPKLPVGRRRGQQRSP